jgi:UDP-glucose 4-epimerase
MRVLITGGAGFIGKALVRQLLARGDEAVVADLKPHPEVPSRVGDLTNPEHLEETVTSDFDAVVHLAAFTSVLASKENPWGVYVTNVEMTARLLEACRVRGIGRFVLASTNAVVGPADRFPIDENFPLRPLTAYGATKAAGEMLASAYSASYRIAASAVRLTNVYGPGMHHKDSFVARLMKAALAGKGVEVYGDGSMRRDYIFVDDAVQGFLLALDQGLSGPIIIGSARSVSVNELIDAARRATGCPIPATYGQPRPGEMPAVEVDISFARKLGFSPQVDLEAGMAATWRSFQEPGG